MKTNLFRIFTLLSLFTINLGFSQSQSMSGEVVSSENGLPLNGVNVILKGTQNGTITDFDGNFVISNVSPDGILVFSSIGFKTIEVEVNNNTSFSISMENDSSQLDEVVIVGYGVQKKENLTGAISTIKLEDAQNRPIANASQALAGKAAGVTVTQNSGQPGADGASIRIRGVGTLGNNNPLVLIDGIRGNLGNVNVADIETITVLKDAASAAIYGSRAANGVVLVTTKTGKTGKFTVNYNGYTGMQFPTKLTDYVTNSVEYMELNNLARFNEDPTSQPGFTTDQINEFRNGADPYRYPNTDWQDLLYRDAQIITHNLSVRGGGKKSTYSFSLGYTDQEGIVVGTDTKQYTARFNLDSQVSDKFKYSLKISGRHDEVNQPVVGSGTLIGRIERASPMQSPRLADGKYGYPWLGFPLNTHPLAGALEGKNNTSWDNLLVNLSGEYELIEGLKLKSSVGINTYHSLQKIFRPEIKLINPVDLSETNLDVGGNPLSAWNRYNTQRDITLVTTLNYEKTIHENHNLNVLAGFNQETSKFQRLQGSKDGVPNNDLQEISAGSTDPTVEGFTTKTGLQSFFGRLNYDFNSKYLLEANVRYDGSSNFGEGNKWGVFPSFSAGWNISNESFMEDVSVVNNLKLRASWGKLGNQYVGINTNSNRTVDQAPPFTSVYSLDGLNYSYGGVLVGGAAQTNLSNPDVTWETSTQTDIGLDVTLFNGKLELVVDYYKKTTEDILRIINISSVVGGLAPPTVNLATVENKGWEVLLNHRNTVGNFEYSASVNFTTIDNEITKLPTPQIENISRLNEGSTINEFYTIKMLGIFQNEAEITAHGAQPTAKPGDIKFEDFDGNGVIDDDDRQAVGQSIPKFTYGFDASAAYKGFDVSMLWQGVEGINAVTEHEQKPFYNYAGIPQFWADNAWTPENPNNEYPRLVRSNSYENNIWRNSSFLVEDASYLRLKNIQLGYTLPEIVLKKIRMDNFRIYINATNPLTFTKYRGLDPEKNPFRTRGSYSNVQVYSLGLNISL